MDWEKTNPNEPKRTQYEPKRTQNKPNFEKSQMNVNFFVTKDYENQPPWGSKSNQTQFAKRQEMNVNFFLTKDYEEKRG